MLLSHHWPEDYHRCVNVRGTFVCRRCLVLYPTALATVVVVAAVGELADTSRSIGWAIVAGLGVAVGVSELVGEQLGSWTYSARRQVVVTVVAGTGAGLLFARYLADPGDPIVWSIALGALVVGGLASLLGTRRRSRVG